MEGQRIPPGIALLKGTAVHVGAEHNYRQKIESKEDLPTTEIIDRAVAALDDRMNAEGLLLSPEEESRGKSIVVGEAKDSTANMAEVLAEEVAPTVQPILVEEKQRILLPDATHDLLGIMDVVDNDEHIRDIKTTGKTKSQADWDSSVQFSFYAILYRAKFGKEAKGIVVDQIVDFKKGPEYRPAFTTRVRADYDALLHRINATLKGIAAGIFTPATPGAWWCSPRFCGFYQTCRYVNAERQAAADHLE